MSPTRIALYVILGAVLYRFIARRWERRGTAKRSPHGTKVRATPGPHVPAPIPDRIGWVGGIESIVLDGTRYFFGFSYSDDRVLSPLIAEPQLMAEFAAAYMEQLNGPHDAVYWRELVDTAVTESGLADAESCVIDSTAIRSFAQALAQVAERDAANPAASLEHHHFWYLLDAALDDGEDYSAVDTERLEETTVSELLQIAAGKNELPEGVSYREVAHAVREGFERMVAHLPANWSLVFAQLSS